MEDILGEWFQRGADWGAIILIDEADVFLEKRQVKDLQRNSLVSGEPVPTIPKQQAHKYSVPQLHGVLYGHVIPRKLPCKVPQTFKLNHNTDNKPHRPNRRRLPLTDICRSDIPNSRHRKTTPHLAGLP
jgi:hypothetical protein